MGICVLITLSGRVKSWDSQTTGMRLKLFPVFMTNNSRLISGYTTMISGTDGIEEGGEDWVVE
jgi:hypothetical protein